MQQQKQQFSGRGGRIPHPTQFTSSYMIMKKKLRFQASSATTFSLFPQSLGDAWCMAATTTSAYQLAENVRVRKIEMWGPPASNLVPVTVSVDWSGSTTPGVFGKSNLVSDTSVGSTEPAYISTQPPPGSQVAQWLSSASQLVLCVITVPLNGILDISYDIVVRDDASAHSVAGTVAGATVGANYVRALDSVSGTSVMVPVSYPTI
jgi:hypothetical protein